MARKKCTPQRLVSVERFTAFKNRFYKWCFRADYGGDILERSTSNHGVIMLSNMYPINGKKLEYEFDVEALSSVEKSISK